MKVLSLTTTPPTKKHTTEKKYTTSVFIPEIHNSNTDNCIQVLNNISQSMLGLSVYDLALILA